MSTIKNNPWFGQAPNKWQQGQLKRFYSVRLGKMLQPNPSNSNDQLIPYIRAANVSWAGPDISDVKEMWASPEEIINNKLEAGDLLISEGGDVGRSCLWSNEIPLCIFQNAINRVRPRQLNSTKFLYYLMQAVKNSGWIDIVCNKATISHFTAEKVNALEIPIPNHTQQRYIAAYLDQQTAKIDRLMDLRQRQMALLKEQRAVLIQQAVTRGFNPDVPMKDSGLPWLGEIPAHWDMVRMKMLAVSLIAGPFGSSIRKDMYVHDGYRVYGQEQVIPDDFSIGDYFITSDKFREMERYSVSPGDVLISCVGSFGKIAVVPINIHPGIINPRLLRLRPKKSRVISEYLGTVLRSYVGFTQMEQEGRGGTMDVINIGLLGQLRLPLPPKNEQAAILEFITDQNGKINNLHSAYSRQLTLLAEYRAALIHECVTGVRSIPDHFNPGVYEND